MHISFSKIVFIKFTLLATISIVFCCCRKKEENVARPTYIAPPESVEPKPEPVQFNFTLIRFSAAKDTLYVDATLENHTTEALNFLVWSCDALREHVAYDTSSFASMLHRFCYTTIPKVEKISPGESIHIPLDLFIKKNSTTLKLGFYYVPIPNGTNIRDVQLTIPNIHDRIFQEENIIWVEEELIFHR